MQPSPSVGVGVEGGLDLGPGLLRIRNVRGQERVAPVLAVFIAPRGGLARRPRLTSCIGRWSRPCGRERPWHDENADGDE